LPLRDGPGERSVRGVTAPFFARQFPLSVRFLIASHTWNGYRGDPRSLGPSSP
jgi:hypothetical protein